MRKHPISLLLVLIGAILLAAAPSLDEVSVPRFKGRSAAEWVSRLGHPELLEKVRALAAIQAMGTNALPAVLDHLGRPDSEFALWCNHFAKWHRPLRFHLAVQPDWRWAMFALLLDAGPESRRAALAGLARLSKDGDAGVRAAALDLLCLSQAIYTEPEALRVLASAQSDADVALQGKAQRWMQAYINWSNIVHGVHTRTPDDRAREGDITFWFGPGNGLPAATDQ